MARLDAIVVGGGIMGASAAWALHARGLRSALIDRWPPGHDRGSSHGDGRIIRFTYDQAIYVQMAERAYRAWAALEAAAGVSLLSTTGGWECGPADSPHLDALERTLRARSVPFERLDAVASRRRFPHLRLAAGSEAIFQADGGIVRAGRAVATLWRLLRAAGAETVGDARVAAIEAGGERVTVRAEDGRAWTAPRLVLTAGGWNGGLLAGQLGLSLPLEVTMEQLAYFPARPGAPDHGIGGMPTVIDYHTDPHFYALPQIDVPGVKVGWHRAGQRIEPDHPRQRDEDNLCAVQAWVGERLPYLETEPIEVTTCLYTNSPDFDFVIDRHPREARVTIGTGFSGHGFKFGPVVGEMLAALALDEPGPIPLDTFRLARLRS